MEQASWALPNVPYDEWKRLRKPFLSTAPEWRKNMVITVEIPEELAKRFGSDPAQLPRHAVEALVLEAHRHSKLTHAEIGHLLGMESRVQIERMLKDHGVEVAD